MFDIEIMSRNTVTAIYKCGYLQVLRNDLVPLYLKTFGNVEGWLISRAIDTTRANAKLLKNALGMSLYDDIAAVMHVNAKTITDTYWVRPLGSELTYNDVLFKENAYAEMSLCGSDNISPSVTHSDKTPELTNTGSFEKCWRLCGSVWKLEKAESKEAAFSEAFICKVGKKLGFNMAEYEITENGSISPDFTDSATVNFEPAFTFISEDHDGDYDYIYDKIISLCPSAAKPFVQMIYLDALFANVDRHTGNYGLLRDTESGELIGFAPLFDHNMALISNGYKDSNFEDLLITDYKRFVVSHPEVSSFIPTLTKDILISSAGGIDDGIDVDKVISIVENRNRMIYI